MIGLGIPANTSGPPVNQFANWLQLRSGLFPDCLTLGGRRYLGYFKANRKWVFCGGRGD